MEKRPLWSDKQLTGALRMGTGMAYELAQEYIYKAWSGEALNRVKELGGTRDQFDDIAASAFIAFERIVRRKEFDYQTSPLLPLFIESFEEAWAIRGFQKQESDPHYIFAYAHVNDLWRGEVKKNILELGGEEADFEELLEVAMHTLARRANSPRQQLRRSRLMELYKEVVLDEWVMAGWKKSSGKHRDAAYIYAWEQWKETGRRSIEGLAGGKSQMDGKQQDFEDVFEEAFRKVFEQVKNKGIYLNHGGLKRYFIVVLIRTWISHEKKQGRFAELPPEKEDDNNNAAEDILDSLDLETKRDMLQGWLNQLDERCRNILLLSQEHSMEELAKIFKWENATVARNQKHRCMKRLLELLPKYLRDNYKPVKGRPRK